jgi:hypothetical protein
MKRPLVLCLAAAGCLDGWAGNARADVALPPTFVVDSLRLDWPLAPVVGLALLASAVTPFFWLRKLRVRRRVAVLLCVLFYGLANFSVFVYAEARDSREREQERLRRLEGR